jgi:4a-hydroxytetrahydrobiopterin dehydratase
MDHLINKSCTACRAGAPLATPQETVNYLAQLPGWQLNVVDGVNQLQKSYAFKNFAQALAFTNQVGAIAEKENHHPAIVTEWGRVTVSWWTHTIKGLHANDFIMAAKTDQIIEEVGP